MVALVPTRPGPLADVPSFSRAIGGAESNVACAMAALGHSARWVSRVGADGFGRCVLAGVAGYGVDVSAVRRDPSRPTGVYFRTAADRGSTAHEVAYYRAGSAASAMSVANVDTKAVRDCRVLHLSGITAGLSAECHDLLRHLTAPDTDRPLISFDINYRPALWRERDAPRTLLELARRADIVFVGEDEAEEVWGVTGGPWAVRELLPEPGVLVVKQGERGATAFHRAAGARAAGARGVPPLDRDRERGRAGAGGTWGTWDTGGTRAVPSGGGASSGPGRATGPRPAAPRRAHEPTATPNPLAGDTAEPTPTTDAAGAFEPAPTVTAVSATGAGDSFAAGYLSATLRALPPRQRLRHGHLLAAATLTTPTDLAPPPARAHADHLA
ncbi:sugar kinase, partial [Streptomyces malaysiense]|uniref:sugar kinase n=1 Tax=Streptomyces malaysiense TaxID=1428626 RepID=UPI001F0A9332